jgi:hypothetical protein
MTRAACLLTGIVAAGLLLAPLPCLAQEQTRISYEGTEAFRNLLHIFYHCEPLKDIADLNTVPRDTVLIVFGDTRVLDKVRKVTSGLDKFRKRGGAVLIASEFDDQGRLFELGLQINGQPLKQTERLAYRGLPDYPLITDMAADHPLFTGLHKGIATHLPGQLLQRFRGNQLPILANLSEVGGWSWPFLAAGGLGGKGTGRAVVLADRSVFTNDLIIRHDNDNFLFTRNTLSWLTEDGRRKRVLLLDNGEVQDRFNVPLATLPPSRIPTEILNQMVRGLEEENRFNQILLEQADLSAYLRAALWGVTFLLVFWGLRRLFQARHQLEIQAPLLARKVALALAAPSVTVQRRSYLRRSDNVWEAARELARACFEIEAVPGIGTAHPPAFEVQGNWHQRWRLGRLVRRLWDLAYGPAPVPVSLRQLAQVQAQAEQVRAALETGRVTFSVQEQDR